MKFPPFLTSSMTASRSRASSITVPCSTAPRTKSLLTNYFTKQVWNYKFSGFTAQVIQTRVFGVIIQCRATSPLQHLRTACCLSIQDDNLFQNAEVRRKCVNYIQWLQWLWPIKAIELWLVSLFLQNPEKNYLLILYNFCMILLTVWHTNNFISDLKTIKFEFNILCQFLHTVLFLKIWIQMSSFHSAIFYHLTQHSSTDI